MPILTSLASIICPNLMPYPLGMLENSSRLPNIGKPHIQPPTDIQSQIILKRFGLQNKKLIIIIIMVLVEIFENGIHNLWAKVHSPHK